jgi:hypothetical protein
MRIDNLGNVGIGTTPETASLLHLKKNGDTKITLESLDANDS